MYIKISNLKSFIHFKKLIQKSLLLIGLFWFGLSFAQYDIPKKPKYIPPVIDSTNTLSPTEFRLLTEKLQNYSDTTSTEILTIIIPTTKGENIGLLAPRWGHKWGIGQAKEDNGVLILLAKEDRKIWIAPGYGVEEKLTAGINGEIIRNIIIPEFKSGNFYEGLDKGTDAIFEVLNGTYKGVPKKQSRSRKGNRFGFLLIIIFIIIAISISKNRRGGGGNRGNRRRGFDIWDAIILSNLGRGGFGGGSGGGFGGGGFGGGGFGGGGGFSGGGAGGSW